MASPTFTADVVVIGGGVMGSATAWRLASRGVDVVLLERFERGHVRGSSHGGSRIFRVAYPDESYVRLAMRALDLWRELEDECSASLLHITGGVDHGDASDVDAVGDALEAAGRDVERLDPDEAEERWPELRFDANVVYSPDTGRVLADASVRAMQDRAAELGADVRFDAQVASIDASSRTVSLTSGASLGYRRATVVTAGAWVGDVLDGTGCSLPPLRVTREQVFHFAPADGGEGLDWPSFIHYRPRSHYGLCTPGEGIKVAEHGTGMETTGDSRTFVIDELGRRRVVDYVKAWLPGLVPSPVTETTCLYTNTPDESFVLDRQGDIVIGSPCSGHGFKFAPAIGDHLANLAVPS